MDGGTSASASSASGGQRSSLATTAKGNTVNIATMIKWALDMFACQSPLLPLAASVMNAIFVIPAFCALAITSATPS